MHTDGHGGWRRQSSRTCSAAAAPDPVRLPQHPSLEEPPGPSTVRQAFPVIIGQHCLELPMHRSEIVPDRLSERIIGCAFRVMNTLGSGFLEKVYENALAHELRKAGLHVSQQHAIVVRYDDVIVGEYAADLLVEGTVVVELKAVKALDRVHIAQSINYLKSTGRDVCLLLNFGKPRLEVQRIVN
jgi:GxxExxY protein